MPRGGDERSAAIGRLLWLPALAAGAGPLVIEAALRAEEAAAALGGLLLGGAEATAGCPHFGSTVGNSGLLDIRPATANVWLAGAGCTPFRLDHSEALQTAGWSRRGVRRVGAEGLSLMQTSLRVQPRTLGPQAPQDHQSSPPSFLVQRLCLPLLGCDWISWNASSWAFLSNRSILTKLPLSPGAIQQHWQQDVFKDGNARLKPERYLTSMAVLDEWLILSSTVVVMCLLDFLLLRKLGGGMLNNLLILATWISAGLGYNVYFGMRYGMKDGLDWFGGFLLEWMLSMDNLFVFLLIFKVYRTPPALMHKALFFGIAGGVICRVLVFLALGTLLHMIHWVRIFFGLVLIYSGLQAVADDEGEEDISNTYAVRGLRWLLGNRLMESYDMQGRLFVRDPEGRLCMTLTVYVILCLEATDIFFAVDSVSAKVAQISNQYIAYSSSVLAIFGLRALFFVVKDLVEYFELLKYGLCIILVFVGVELILSPILHLESGTVCIVILSVFTVSMTASTAKKLWGLPDVKAPWDARPGHAPISAGVYDSN